MTRLAEASTAARRGMLVAAAQWQGVTARFMSTAYGRLLEAQRLAQQRAPRSKVRPLVEEARYFIQRAEAQLRAKNAGTVRPLLDRAEALALVAMEGEA